MTAPRQQQKRRYPGVTTLAAAIVAAGLAAPGHIPPAAAAGTLQRVVVDAASGLAINGFDPVAYFARGEAAQGRPEFELRLAGVIWRFENDGNRAAFAAHSDIYAPQFGGFDPVAIGRDVAVPGNPLIWVISGERLYFFYDKAARTAFLDDPGRVAERARQQWPAVAYMASP